MASRPALLHRVVRGNREQRCSRLGALNIRQCVCRGAESRIGARALHYNLQIRRIPALEYDLNRFVVADLARCNGSRDSRAFGADASNRLRA